MRSPIPGEGVVGPVDPEVRRARNKTNADAIAAPSSSPIPVTDADIARANPVRQQQGDWTSGYELMGAMGNAQAAYKDQQSHVDPNTGMYYPGQGSTNDAVRVAAAQKRLDEANARVATWQQRIAKPVQEYPSLAKAMLEVPNLTEADVRRVVNLASAWTVADSVLRLYDQQDDYRAFNTLMSLPPQQRMVVQDIIDERIKQSKKEQDAAQAKDTADLADKATWGPARLATQGVGEALGTAAGMLLSNGYEGIQHALRASLAYNYGTVGGHRTDPMFWWDLTDAGQHDPRAIADIKAKHGEMPVDLILEIKQMQNDGDPHPISTAIAKYWNDPAKARVLQLLTQKQYGPTEGMTEADRVVAQQNYDDQQTLLSVADKVASASLDDLGAMAWTTNPLTGFPIAADNPFRASMAQQGLSAATNVVSTFVFDPVIVGSKVRSVFLVSKYALDKIAIDAAEGAARSVLEKPKTYAYLKQFTGDIAKYLDIVNSGGDASKFAAAMHKRYARYFPPDVIQSLADAGIRSPEQFIKYVEDTNNTLRIERGQAALRAAGSNGWIGMPFTSTDRASVEQVTRAAINNGADPDMVARAVRSIEDRSMYGRMVRQQEGRRGAALLPRQNDVSALRRDLSSAISRVGSDSKARARVRALYEDINNPDMSVGVMLNADPQAVAQFNEYSRVGRIWDKTTRLLSQTPGKTAIYTKDGRDSAVFYRFARIFVGKAHADYLAEKWRTGTQGDRIMMWVGLVQTASEKRGWSKIADREINLGSQGRLLNGKDTVSVQELRNSLVFGTDPRTLFAVDSLSVNADGVAKPLAQHIDDQVQAWVTANTPTGTTLYHGTNRAFDELSAEASPRGRRSLPRSDGKRNLYFTDNPDEAMRFAKESGDVVSLPDREWHRDAYDRLIQDAGSPEAAVDDAVAKYDFWGDMPTDSGGWEYRKLTKEEILSQWEEGSSPYGYPKGTAPRVIEKTIHGKIFDLSPLGKLQGAEYEKWVADNVPEDLATALRDEGTYDAVFNPYNGVNWQGHERSAALGQWAWDNGYSAVKVPDSVKGGYSYIVHPEALEGSAAPTPEEIANYRADLWKQYATDPNNTENVIKTNPADFNGNQLALHLWQTSDYLAVPNLSDIQLITNRSQAMNHILGSTPGSFSNVFVNYWSLLTLAGFRYSTRNAIEDWAMYALTGGHILDAMAGRAMSTGVREARGKNIGWFARKMRRASGEEAPPGEHYGWWQNYILPMLNKQERADAVAAMHEGDADKWLDLVVHATVRTKLGRNLSAREQQWLKEFVKSDAKFAELDDIADATRNAGLGEIDGPAATSSGNKGTGVIGGSRRFEQAPFQGIVVQSSSPESYRNWHMALDGILNRDGDMGRVAVQYLDDTEKAVREVADVIRNDTKYGYKERLAALNNPTHEVSVDEFARRYVQDVLNTFSMTDGSLNVKLWRKFVRNTKQGRQVAWGDMVDGERIPRVTVADLQKMKSNALPANVLGRGYSDSVVIPNRLDEKVWNAMSEAVARVSREPVYYANWLRGRKEMWNYEQQLAQVVGPEAAGMAANRAAMDRAMTLTLAYTDNPNNQTMLAWRMRNFARYYRATEDFYRRMYRMAKFHPVGFYKGWLALNVLDETGFVYTDSYGDRYFMYPGDSLMNSVVGDAFNYIGKMDSVFTSMMPSVFGGKVKMLSPSFDPSANAPMLSGPLAAVLVKSVTNRFPQFEEAEKYLIGQYGAQANIWQSALPSSVLRVLGPLNQDERTSVFASAAMNAAKVIAAAGRTPDYSDSSGRAQFAEDLGNVANQIVFLRSALGWIVPAAPQGYSNDVTTFARGVTGADAPKADATAWDTASDFVSKWGFDAGKTGLDGMSKVYRDLLSEEIAAGSQDPFASALIKGVAVYGPSFSVYAEPVTERGNGDLGIAPILYDDKLKTFQRDNADLLHKYPGPAMYLAPVRDPQKDRYSAEARRILIDKGYLRTSSMDPYDPNSYVSRVIAAEAKYTLMLTKDAADAAINSATTDEERKRQELNRTEAYDRFDAMFPGYRDHSNADTGMYMADLKQFVNAPQGSIRSMIADFYAGKYGPVPNSVKFIAEALSTFDYFNAQYDQVTGQTKAERDTKRTLREQQVANLQSVAADDPNADQFIRRVLFPMMGVSADGRIRNG